MQDLQQRVKLAESARDNAIERAKIAKEEKKKLEKLINLVPQAEIKGVKIEERRRNIDISGTFSIKNRKDIEGSVKASFFFKKNERPLLDKHRDPITMSEDFTPKRVTDTLKVELSMPYAKLNVKQAYDLEFELQIYDKPTESFLDKEPYLRKFHFDPLRD